MKPTDPNSKSYDKNKWDDEFFKKIYDFSANGYLMAAGSSGVDKTLVDGRDTVQGSIVPGHAYSIMSIKTPMLTSDKVRLIQLRNPWGSMEWKGAWSDNSELWNTHPGVALEVGRVVDDNDGIFFMSWEDFLDHFNMIDVLIPNFGVENLHFRSIGYYDHYNIIIIVIITIFIYHHTFSIEEYHYCGSCAGLTIGCFNYWCLCLGILPHHHHFYY